jgi:LuxR family maltose regulon positive regulatory protein
VYISAVAGWGKSAAVKYYYENKPVLVLSGNSGTLSDMPDIDAIRRGTVVIDDISWLTDVSSRDYVIKLLAEGGKNVVLIGRASFPQWMSELMLQHDFLRIGEKDLQFGMDEIAEYMKKKVLALTDEELAEVLKKTYGYLSMVAMYSEYIGVGESIDGRMYTAVCRNLGGYFDRIFFSRWENDVQQMLLFLCQYSRFTLPMAELLTGSKDTYRNLRYCYHVGSFLIKIDDNTWAFREHFTDFLKWKQRALWTEEMFLENYRRAALYFETIGDFENALLYYHKAGMKEQIKNLLMQNAGKHLGEGSYYQMRKYYMELPEDIIMENPVLMCGMSMLNSIMLHPEEAEKCYQKLQEYGNGPYINAEERKEAKTLQGYHQ